MTETGRIRMSRLQKPGRRAFQDKGLTNKCIGLGEGKDSLYLRNRMDAWVTGA